MIGYMKRYDWCFERFCQMAARLPVVRFSRVHDFACRFDKSDYLFGAFPPSRGTARPLQNPATGWSGAVSASLLL